MKHSNPAAEDSFEKARSAFFGEPDAALNTGAASDSLATPQNEAPARERSSQPAGASAQS